MSDSDLTPEELRKRDAYALANLVYDIWLEDQRKKRKAEKSK